MMRLWLNEWPRIEALERWCSWLLVPMITMMFVVSMIVMVPLVSMISMVTMMLLMWLLVRFPLVLMMRTERSQVIPSLGLHIILVAMDVLELRGHLR